MSRISLFFVVVALLVKSACGPYSTCMKKPDNSFVPTVYGAMFPTIVSYDSAHNNYHRISGSGGCPSFAPFEKFLEAQGHVIGKSLTAYPFAIANPENENEVLPSNLHVVVTPQIAHTQEEVQEMRLFVETAGNLLVTTDHADYPEVVAELVTAFGVNALNARIQCASDGYACIASPSEDGRIPLTQTVGAVKLYEGTAFTFTSPNAVCEIAYGPGAVNIVTGASAEGWCHTVSVVAGCGKVLIAGSNEPFTAMKNNFGTEETYGLSDPTNPDAEEWLQNQMEWVSSRLQIGEETCPL